MKETFIARCALILCLVAVTPAFAQSVTGLPGSPGTTTTIDKLTYTLGLPQMTNDEQKRMRHALERARETSHVNRGESKHHPGSRVLNEASNSS